MTRTECLLLSKLLQEFVEVFESDSEFLRAEMEFWEKILLRSIVTITKHLPTLEDHEVQLVERIISALQKRHESLSQHGLKLSPLEVYSKSIRKVVLRRVFEVSEVPVDAVARSNQINLAIHHLFVLLNMMGKDTYPVVNSISVFEEFEQLFQTEFRSEMLSIRSLDLINEIRFFLSNSNKSSFYKDFITADEVRTAVVRRLRELQTNLLSRRKKPREQIIELIKQVASEEALQIIETHENLIDDNGLLSDLVVVYKRTEGDQSSQQRLHVFLHSITKIRTSNTLELIGYRDKEPLYCELRKPVLNYLGINALFINLPDWINKTSQEQSRILKDGLIP